MPTNDGDNDVQCCVSCGGLFGWPTLDFRTQMCSACYADAEAAKRLPEVVIVTLDLMENPVLGAVLNTVDGQLIVVRTEPGTEAAKRGITRGMALVRYAGMPLHNLQQLKTLSRAARADFARDPPLHRFVDVTFRRLAKPVVFPGAASPAHLPPPTAISDTPPRGEQDFDWRAAPCGGKKSEREQALAAVPRLDPSDDAFGLVAPGKPPGAWESERWFVVLRESYWRGGVTKAEFLTAAAYNCPEALPAIVRLRRPGGRERGERGGGGGCPLTGAVGKYGSYASPYVDERPVLPYQYSVSREMRDFPPRGERKENKTLRPREEASNVHEGRRAADREAEIPPPKSPPVLGSVPTPKLGASRSSVAVTANCHPSPGTGGSVAAKRGVMRSLALPGEAEASGLSVASSTSWGNGRQREVALVGGAGGLASSATPSVREEITTRRPDVFPEGVHSPSWNSRGGSQGGGTPAAEEPPSPSHPSLRGSATLPATRRQRADGLTPLGPRTPLSPAASAPRQPSVPSSHGGSCAGDLAGLFLSGELTEARHGKTAAKSRSPASFSSSSGSPAPAAFAGGAAQRGPAPQGAAGNSGRSTSFSSSRGAGGGLAAGVPAPVAFAGSAGPSPGSAPQGKRGEARRGLDAGGGAAAWHQRAVGGAKETPAAALDRRVWVVRRLVVACHEAECRGAVAAAEAASRSLLAQAAAPGAPEAGHPVSSPPGALLFATLRALVAEEQSFRLALASLRDTAATTFAAVHNPLAPGALASGVPRLVDAAKKELVSRPLRAAAAAAPAHPPPRKGCQDGSLEGGDGLLPAAGGGARVSGGGLPAEASAPGSAGPAGEGPEPWGKPSGEGVAPPGPPFGGSHATPGLLFGADAVGGGGAPSERSAGSGGRLSRRLSEGRSDNSSTAGAGGGSRGVDGVDAEAASARGSVRSGAGAKSEKSQESVPERIAQLQFNG